MLFNPRVHHRRSIRLKGYDYTLEGAYFVTLTAWQRECTFGRIQEGKVVLSEVGKLIENCWLRLEQAFTIQLDVWVIMPNHFHGILCIQDSRTSKTTTRTSYNECKSFSINASSKGRPIGTESGSLGAILQNFKSVSTRKCNQLRSTPGAQFWQRNYYERIIRDEEEWEKIRLYIQENPIRWTEDAEM